MYVCIYTMTRGSFKLKMRTAWDKRDGQLKVLIQIVSLHRDSAPEITATSWLTSDFFFRILILFLNFPS